MLDAKGQKILEYISKRINEGVPPSVREICTDIGIKSTSTVHKYLKLLEQEGYIEREQNLNRSIKMPHSSTVRIPLLGTVTAGMPILAVEQIEDYIPYKASASAQDLFALHIKGDSMINAGILDGDIIVVRKTDYAMNGQIVVALIEDEATVKRFYREKGGGFRLQPENDDYEPILVDEVRILGRVLSVLRFYE